MKTRTHNDHLWSPDIMRLTKLKQHPVNNPVQMLPFTGVNKSHCPHTLQFVITLTYTQFISLFKITQQYFFCKSWVWSCLCFIV